MAAPLLLTSVPAQTPYVQYVAGSGQTVFPYPFEITQDHDLVCLVNGVQQGTDVGYTLSGQGNDTGGNLTFTLGRTSGDIVTIYRDITIARATQLPQNGTFFSSTFNNEYNRIYLIMQQLEESIGFSLQIPFTNNPAPVTTLLPASYANKYLAFDSYGNPEPAVLTSSGSLTQSIIAGLLYPAVAWETAGSVTLINQTFPPGNALRYAVADGVTDVTAALQTVLNAMSSGMSLYFPAQPSYWKISSALTIPAGHIINVFGDGINSQIYQVTAGANVFTSGSTWATANNNTKFARLNIGSSGGNYGIALNGTCRASIKDCYFSGFTSSATSAGIGIIDSLILDIEGNHFSTCYNGVYSVGSTNTAWNGGSLINNDFEAMTGYALYADYLNGLTIAANVMESCHLGGMAVYLGGGGLAIHGNYFEGNCATAGDAGAVEFADIALGFSSYINGVDIRGNYFNGNDSVARSSIDYVPIRLKFALGIVVEGNMLNTGSNFVNFEPSGNVSQSRFGLIGFHAAGPANFDYTTTATATYSAGTQASPTALPSIFNTIGNGITIEGLSRIAGTINQQFLRYVDLPISYAVWTFTSTNGTLNASGAGVYVDTSTSASSTAIASIPELAMSTSQGQANIDYTKEVIFDSVVNNITAGTSTGAAWLMLAGAAGAADPSTVAMGFKIIDNEIWGICCDGTTATLVDLGLALSAGISTQLKAIWAAPTLTWYVNGVVAGSTTSHVPAGQVAATLVLSAANGANAARQRLGLYDCKISVSQ